jgi:predicted nucleic acid-binding protein
MSFLLDTNVISELTRRRKNPGVLDWFAATRSAEHYVSVLTIGEIGRGINRLRRRGDHQQAASLELFLTEVRSEYHERIMPVLLGAADKWSQQPPERPVGIVDALIGATAQANGWTLVTRNTKDFEPLGVRLLNPFSG